MSMWSASEAPKGEKWYSIYPAYVNSNRTLAAGRRLSRSECVSDPKWTEIRDVLEANPLFKVDANANKCYPRELDKESPVSRGRVRYQCSDSAFAHKRDVLKYVAVMIPKLKSRSKAVQNEQNANTNTTAANVKKKRSKK